jgi:membrane protease YdiL (CAAX protease family)
MMEWLLVGLTTVTFASLWISNAWVWRASYLVLLLVGLYSSIFNLTSILVMLVVAGLLNYYTSAKPFSLFAGILAALIGLALGLHVVPGFDNFQYLESAQLSATAATFDLWFNFDKSLFGLFFVGFVLHSQLIRTRGDLAAAIKQSAPIALGGILFVYALGMLIGYSRFDWTPALVFLPWALKNIVFTVLAEEVFFRGFVQRELALRITHKYSGDIAVVVAGVLFGIAHFAGGLPYVLLSSVAGIVYGYTYKVSGRIEAPIAAHFLLNAGHFLLFSYPYSVV